MAVAAKGYAAKFSKARTMVKVGGVVKDVDAVAGMVMRSAAKVGMGMANAGAAVENAVKDGAISVAKGVGIMAVKADGGASGCSTRPSCNCFC